MARTDVTFLIITIIRNDLYRVLLSQARRDFWPQHFNPKNVFPGSQGKIKCHGNKSYKRKLTIAVGKIDKAYEHKNLMTEMNLTVKCT